MSHPSALEVDVGGGAMDVPPSRLLVRVTSNLPSITMAMLDLTAYFELSTLTLMPMSMAMCLLS
jgi:hypothetical protein